MTNDEKQNEDQSKGDRNPDDYHVDTFKQALEDARRTHDQQLEAYNDIDEKGWRVLRFNGIVATVAMAGAVSIENNPSVCAVVLFLGGIGLLSWSTYRIMYKQPIKEVTLGPSTEDLENIMSKNPKEGVYLEWMTKRYAEWSDIVTVAVEENSANVDLAKLLSVLGTAFMLGGGILHVTSHIT